MACRYQLWDIHLQLCITILKIESFCMHTHAFVPFSKQGSAECRMPFILSFLLYCLHAPMSRIGVSCIYSRRIDGQGASATVNQRIEGECEKYVEVNTALIISAVMSWSISKNFFNSFLEGHFTHSGMLLSFRKSVSGLLCRATCACCTLCCFFTALLFCLAFSCCIGNLCVHFLCCRIAFLSYVVQVLLFYASLQKMKRPFLKPCSAMSFASSAETRE